VVTDSSTSNGLTKFIAEMGGKLLRYKKGYRYVIELGRETKNCVLAMEASGHGGFSKHNFIDDGIYTAIRVLIELHSLRIKNDNNNISISDIITDFNEACESSELRLNMLMGNSFENREKATMLSLQCLKNVVMKIPFWEEEPINYEGLRVMIKNEPNGVTGWLMLRASLHEPIISLQFESEVKGGSKDILNLLLLNGFDELEKLNILDLSNIRKFINQ